jgi:hypothetical protein
LNNHLGQLWDNKFVRRTRREMAQVLMLS